jgi:hypothetical protein
MDNNTGRVRLSERIWIQFRHGCEGNGKVAGEISPEVDIVLVCPACRTDILASADTHQALFDLKHAFGSLRARFKDVEIWSQPPDRKDDAARANRDEAIIVPARPVARESGIGDRQCAAISPAEPDMLTRC